MDQALAGRIEMRCSRMLERSSSDLPNLLRDENWKGIPGVAKGKARDALMLGMLKARKGEKLNQVIEVLGAGAHAANYLLRVPSESLPVSSLDIPLYLCLISGNFQLAIQLATRIKEEKLAFVKGSYSDLHTKMISGFVLSDIDTVITHERELFELPKNYWWEMQRLYFDMYKAVVIGDAESLRTNINKLNDHFASRAHDRKFGDQLSEYGGLDYNQFCLDFMALGILAYAIHGGMEISYDSRFVPLVLLRHANSTA